MKTTVHGPLEFDVLAEGVGFPEGPVISSDGTVHVVDIDGGVIWRVDDGGPTVVARPGAGPNGMAPETATTALVANNGGFLWTEVRGTRIPIDHVTHTNEPPGFAVVGSSGSTSSEAPSRCCTGRVRAALCAGPTTWCSTRRAGCGSPITARAAAKASTAAVSYYVPPDGSRVVEKAFPLLGPNGVGLSPDGRRVYVAETHTGRVWAWDLAGPGEIRPAAGNLAVRHGGVCLVATPFSFDSLGVEADGRLVIGAIADGIVVVTPDGQEVDVHPIPGDVTTNMAFGGPTVASAVLTLSRSGRVVETVWPRAGLVVGPVR